MLDQEEGEEEVDDHGLLAENDNNVGAVDPAPKLTRDLVRKGIEDKKYELRANTRARIRKEPNGAVHPSVWDKWRLLYEGDRQLSYAVCSMCFDVKVYDSKKTGMCNVYLVQIPLGFRVKVGLGLGLIHKKSHSIFIFYTPPTTLKCDHQRNYNTRDRIVIARCPPTPFPLFGSLDLWMSPLGSWAGARCCTLQLELTW